MRTTTALAAALALIGCSEPPKKAETKKKEEKPLEPATGRQAFQHVYPAARAWAPDAQPLQITSLRLAEVKAEPGKSGAWQIVFVSPARGRSKTFTWSAIESEGNLHKGVFALQEESWNPRGQAKPFPLQAIQVDTPAALETAEKHGDVFFKKVKERPPVNFLLESTPRFPNVYWRVMWGESVGTADFTVFVDASSGAFLERN